MVMLNDDVSKHLSPCVRTAGSLAPQLHCEGLDRCSPCPRRRKITGAGTTFRLAARSLFWSSCGVERYDLSEIFPQTFLKQILWHGSIVAAVLIVGALTFLGERLQKRYRMTIQLLMLATRSLQARRHFLKKRKER